MSGKRKPYNCGEENPENARADFLAGPSKTLDLPMVRKIQSGKLNDYLLMIMLGTLMMVMVLVWF